MLNAYSPTDDDVSRRVEGILADKSADAYGMEREDLPGLTKLKYFLVEDDEGEKQSSANLFGFTKDNEIHITVYYDADEFLPEIDLMWKSLKS